MNEVDATAIIFTFLLASVFPFALITAIFRLEKIPVWMKESVFVVAKILRGQQ